MLIRNSEFGKRNSELEVSPYGDDIKLVNYLNPSVKQV